MSAPIYLKFNELPKQIQEKILERLKDKSGSFYLSKSTIFSEYVLIFLSVIWIGTLFLLANDYLWSDSKIVFFSLLTALALYLLWQNAYKIFKFYRSPLKPGLLVTSHYILVADSSQIRFWNMEQLFSVNSSHNHQNGAYVSTKVTLELENGSETFWINNIERAEETVEKITDYRKTFIEATARKDENYLNSAEDFMALNGQDQPSLKTPNNYLSHLITGFTSILITAGLMFGAIALNNFYDDRKSWSEAESANRATSYRNYLQTHLKGRWIGAANQKLQNLYDEAEQKYQASLNQGFDPKAVEAVKQALRYAKETKNYQVKLVFERHNDIPPDIVDILKKEYEVKKVLTFGDSFSDEKINQREKLLSTRITEAFNVVIPNDILEFSSECNDNCITFLVKYTIDSDSIYYNTLEDEVPEAKRTWRPGIWFDWDFIIKTPNNPQIYDFNFESDPAAEIFYDSKIEESDVGKDSFERKMEAEKVIFFDAVVESAFDDFKANLVYRLGIGEKPRKEKGADQNDKPETENGKQEGKKK